MFQPIAIHHDFRGLGISPLHSGNIRTARPVVAYVGIRAAGERCMKVKSRMNVKEPKPTRVLVIAFALSTACFLFATIATTFTSFGIGDAARKIALDTSPSIQRLSHVRGSLRRLEVVLTAYVTGDRAVLRASDVAALTNQVESQLDEYYVSRMSPEERAMQLTIQERWTRLQRGVADVVALRDESADMAKLELFHLRTSFEAFDAGIVQSLDLKNRQSNQLAEQIVVQWKRANSSELMLTALSVLMTLATAGLAIYLVRKQTRLLARRADESMQFAGRVAHDILSPLSPIRVFLDLADKMGLGNEKLERLLPATKSSLLRLVGTVDALLAFAKAGAQAPAGAACNVREVVQGVIDDQTSTAQTAHVELKVSPVSKVWIACAPGVLASVLSNLLRNAMKYMGDSTTRVVQLVVTDQGNQLRFEVADTGPGIAKEWLKSIFDPFKQVSGSSSGIGLGLSTVKRLVLAHGGKIGVDSTVGRGSRFWFTLPKAPRPAEESASQLPEAAAS